MKFYNSFRLLFYISFSIKNMVVISYFLYICRKKIRQLDK